MRKLDEQWIEEFDGKKHMLKAVGPVDLCQGCCFNCNQGGCCWKGFDDCQMGNFLSSKTLAYLMMMGVCRVRSVVSIQQLHQMIMVGGLYFVMVIVIQQDLVVSLQRKKL